jgi:hypothetical protein
METPVYSKKERIDSMAVYKTVRNRFPDFLYVVRQWLAYFRKKVTKNYADFLKKPIFRVFRSLVF